MNHNIVAIDVFCGAGGLTFGLQKAGINVIKGIDLDSSVEETYTKNNPKSQFLKSDIKDVTKESLLAGVDRSKNRLLLAGCAPCQPFSLQNQKRAMKDRRRSLIMEFYRLVKETLPEYILIENVPGFMKENNKYHTHFVVGIRELGYNYVEKIVNAVNYGVPQIRRRYVLLASRLEQITFPEETHGMDKKPPKTVGDTIKKYPRITAGSCYKKIPNHISKNLSPKNMQRIKLIPKNGGSRSSLPKNLVLDCHKNYSGHSDVYGRMDFNKPSPTLTCKCTSFSNGRFGHPTQNRSISVREAAALQTFPESYVFYGTITKVSTYVGNSVPVKLSFELGKTFIKASKHPN
jgi:DNA (cytosine-5)-methyltransferase 1